MKARIYKVMFVDVGISIEVDALISEIAMDKAEKELKRMYGDDLELGNKVNLEVIGYANV
jgi:hypothetical protein